MKIWSPLSKSWSHWRPHRSQRRALPMLLIGTLRSDNVDVLENTALKIDLASFQTNSRLFQDAQLLKRSEFMLELKREDCARVQTDMVEFITLPFSSSSKLKIWSFHVVVVQGRQRNVQKCMRIAVVAGFFILPAGALKQSSS